MDPRFARLKPSTSLICKKRQRGERGGREIMENNEKPEKEQESKQGN